MAPALVEDAVTPVGKRTGRSREELPGGIERHHQGVHVMLVVVQGERRPSRGVDPEAAHEGLGAVVAGTYAHPVLIQDLGDVVGMDVAEGEREDTAPGYGFGGAEDADAVTAISWARTASMPTASR